jgi:hypothetical protein
MVGADVILFFVRHAPSGIGQFESAPVAFRLMFLVALELLSGSSCFEKLFSLTKGFRGSWTDEIQT